MISLESTFLSQNDNQFMYLVHLWKTEFDAMWMATSLSYIAQVYVLQILNDREVA